MLFAYNTATHPATGYTPYYLVHGREAIIGSETVLKTPPWDFQSHPSYVKNIQRQLWASHRHIENRVQQQADARERLNGEMKSTATYATGEQVMVYKLPKSLKGISAKLLSPYVGPCTVMNRFNDVSYQVKRNDNNKKMVVHVSRMKRYIQRDKDMHQALQEANAEAERDAAGVLVLPLQAPDADVIADAVGGSTRARVAARPSAQQASRPRTQRVKWWKDLHSTSSPEHKQSNTEEDVKQDEQDDESPLTSSPPVRAQTMPRRVIDIAHDSDEDMEEGEVRVVLRCTHPRTHRHHQH